MINFGKSFKRVLIRLFLLSSLVLWNHANASLASNSTLIFDTGVNSCFLNEGSYPNCTYGSYVSSGSYMGMDTNNNYIVDQGETAALDANQGISLGTIQELGGIDNQWVHYELSGQHYTTSPVSILSDDNAGNVTLDLSGWSMQLIWGYGSFGTEYYHLGGGNPSYPDETGIATLTCSSDCSNGDRFVLDYYTHTLAMEGGNALPNTAYELHLEGTITAVPLPVGFWLLVSGLFMFAGFVRKTT